MTTLILTNRVPSSRLSGYDLRVVSLCGFLDGPLHLLAFPVNSGPTGGAILDPGSIFETWGEIPARASAPSSVRRHLRRSDADHLRLAHPQVFGAAVGAIREAVRRLGVSRTVAFGTNLAGLVSAAGCPRTVFDVCDSVALTQRREFERRAPTAGALTRMRQRTQLVRSERCEARLPHWFSQVTTISRPDSEEIVRLSGSASNVHTVPNGVDPAFLAPWSDDGRATRAVAFWGNLDFAPNREALRHFFDDVYVPYLRPEAVGVRVIGSAPEPWLVDLARHDARVEVLGHVDDLAGALAGYPVLVNPMVIGSGLKNKVLEAFGLGLAVVSTTLGIEAIPDAVDGEHYLGADDARSFAEAVLGLVDDEPRRLRLQANARALVELSYRWDVIGRQWHEICATA